MVCISLKTGRCKVVGLLVNVLLAVLFVCGHVEDASAEDNIPPTVVSTNPSNGAIGVSADLDTVSVTFSEPMAPTYSISNSGSWGESVQTWSGDKTKLYMTRENAGTPLSEGETIFFTLNPAGSYRFQDLEGNYLETYTFSFGIGESSAPTVVSTTPANGATGVSPDLEVVSITFSKPMGPGHSICSNFPGYSVDWSEDQTRIYLIRDDPTTPLIQGVTYTFTLNGPGSTAFQDLSGNPLATYTFSFTTREELIIPTVVSTIPPNGATEISPDVETISITFSEPMAPSVSYTSIGEWGSSSYEWSQNQTTIHITRNSAGTPLMEGSLITLILNPEGYPNFRDLSGNFLETYTLCFTIAAPYQLLKIPENPDKGFYWPYYLSIPDSLNTRKIS